MLETKNTVSTGAGTTQNNNHPFFFFKKKGIVVIQKTVSKTCRVKVNK